MFRVVEGKIQGSADVDEFMELINEPPETLHDFFGREFEIFVARAPGRLDVMGGIADYSGSLVLEMPIAEATLAAVQKKCRDERIRIVSVQSESIQNLEFEMNLADLTAADSLGDARSFFRRDRRNHWASYTAGAFFVLQHELGVEFKTGANILIASRVPVGKGVSSSAAIEVATMHAVCAAYDIDIDPRQIAILCQKVENHVVGAPCGIMDQMTSSCAVEDSLLSLLCQPAEIQSVINVPGEIEFWGVDSGVRHSVAGADYSSVRTSAFIGYRMIAEKAGLDCEWTGENAVKVNDERWGGYLANISPDEYERYFRSTVPPSIGGDEFLSQYGGITDPVATIDRSIRYNVRAATDHAIYESSRVRQFVGLLGQNMTQERLLSIGKLMFESHNSYAACGLTEPRTDRIVELVRQNSSQGLFGARITGGGSGGTVAILAQRNNRKAIDRLIQELEDETGQRPYVFHGSSPGAARFGHIRLGYVTDSQQPRKVVPIEI